MALPMHIGFLRSSVVTGLGRAIRKTLLVESGSAKFPIQTASISGKLLRDKDIQKPKPWPYKERGFNFFYAIFDKTSKRLDENSKIIVVDGPVACGKTTFAKKLAEDLDFLYVPEANMDMLYINSYGFDRRELDPQLPASYRSFDEKDFLKNPHHINAGVFQIEMYKLRYFQYCDALAHLLNTGQGIVMDRSVYSDLVYLESSVKMGFLSARLKSYYYDMRENTIHELLRPHLAIYLDVPVPVVLDRIKKRNRPLEINSKALSAEYLNNMEYFYKQQYLKEINKHAEVLMYDWSDYGDAEIVLEDIERIDFEAIKAEDLKKKDDWKFRNDWERAEARYLYTCDKYSLNCYCDIPRWDVPELLASAEDTKIRDDVYDKTPTERYAPGFNAAAGDKNIWLKL